MVVRRDDNDNWEGVAREQAAFGLAPTLSLQHFPMNLVQLTLRYCSFGLSFHFRPSTWISLFRLLTLFVMRPAASLVMLLHFFLCACFKYERLPQSLSKQYFILR
jgi:hypothetical protein